ncbi:unnamed protein product [Tuber melanosporum]|uniref:(Perigord truffle) hypothetical protein n=1 Tax=Tuber melanosporum (strain Mel28) TaxID=656061 RepID=D5G4G5_TUBMM|nr:uncharacterized protein GSTUM_00004097001 [Tuber melanosporum]CAZ79408.1 unnamed protein product [Tuber melanosporum]
MWCRLSEATPQKYFVATRGRDVAGFVLRLSGSSSFVFIFDSALAFDGYRYCTNTMQRGSPRRARHASHASLQVSGLWHKLLSCSGCAGLLCFRRCDGLLRMVIEVMDMVMAL